MKLIRKLFFITSAGLLAWIGITAYNRLTDGFSIYQMTSSLPPCPQYEVNLTPEKKQELQHVLDQKFHYLGKGCQFYVFESDDGNFVIKFLKHKHLRLFAGINKLPLPLKMRQIFDQKISQRVERVDRLFSSCKIAYEKLPEETGLLFIHLNRTPAVEKAVMLVDKLGRKHIIEMDKFEFFIQKKGTPLKEVLAHSTSAEVPSTVQQLADLVLLRCQKGICDRDPAFVQNVAFAEGKPIFIDIGQFYEDPIILQKDEQLEDLEKRFGNLHEWMEQHFPNFASLFCVIN